MRRVYSGEVKRKISTASEDVWLVNSFSHLKSTTVIVNCWFGLVVWDSRGAPK